MNAISPSLIGVGLYSTSEASELTGVPVASIRRWLEGYRYRRGEVVHNSAPVWKQDVPRVGDHITLSFLDMMEARFIQSFRKHRLSWAAIREAAKLACEMFDDEHPFTRGRFRTDGNRIFHQIEAVGDVKLFDMNKRHWVFNDIVERSLFSDIELAGDQVVRWYPMPRSKAIVVDPQLAFGRPVLAQEGVPTDVLAAAVKANDGDIESVSRWYQDRPQAVRAALAFEERLISKSA